MLILLFNAYLPENMLYMKEYIKKEKKDIEIKEKKKNKCFRTDKKGGGTSVLLLIWFF